MQGKQEMITYRSSEGCLVRARECKLPEERAVSRWLINVKGGLLCRASARHKAVVAVRPNWDQRTLRSSGAGAFTG